VIKILETAQKKVLRTLVEEIKELLEKNFEKKLLELGIQRESSNLIDLENLVEYELLESEHEKTEFKETRQLIWNEIEQESQVLEDWNEAYYWYLDKMVYTFFNRIFALRIMEELDLLNESTLVPQSDLGNRSARMRKIQEKFFDKSEEEWHILVLKDAFTEISQDIKVIFDESDPYMKIWPDGDVIAMVIQKLNGLDPAIYKAEDCIGWFYHYYVLKLRKGHKTMSSHGSKSPKNSYYLSILNTVYTPRWMIRVLVDNSLGHWWQNLHPQSKIFLDSPFFIKKIPVNIQLPTNKLEKLKILDPACGSGNFLVYIFGKLVEMYREMKPDLPLSKIIEIILLNNIYGIDINRRPAQLSALALYIMAKRILKEHSLNEFLLFRMPPVNIICCDVRTPSDEHKILLLQKIKNDAIKKVIKDVINQFNNADELGSLIDIRGLQTEINKLVKPTLESFFGTNKTSDLDLVKIIDEEIFTETEQNIGIRIFGHQTRKALTLARALMQKYDIIVGNPPFGLMMDSTKEKIRSIYPHSYRDLVSSFIDQSLRLLRKNGFIAMVTDFSFMHLSKFQKFRENILLTKAYIQYLLVTGLGALPNARNVPALFILRNISVEDSWEGLYRYIEYSSSQQFHMDVYISDIKNAIEKINNWIENEKIPRGWSKITQNEFLNLPQAVIDLNIAEKFKPLIEFFTQFPRLDINQHNKAEKARLSNSHLARAFEGISTGNNDHFVRLWHEIPPTQIRKAELIETVEEVPIAEDRPFVPYSKGGGDTRYYLNNGYVLWWTKESIKLILQENGVIRNAQLIGRSHLHWPLSAGKPRGRFNISQSHLVCDSASMGIHILENDLNKFALLAYLNSKFGCFLGRLQTKDRKWQAGNVARFPIPLDFLIEHHNELNRLSKESFELRRDWDTGYPMSPIFAESFIDKVLKNNKTISNPGIPKTGHPFCEEYIPCESETAKKIHTIQIEPKEATIQSLLDAIEQRFEILISRLDEIDDQINRILYGLIDEKTVRALDEYYETYVGRLVYVPERKIWLKDFLMANLLELIKNTKKGVIPLDTYNEDKKGLFETFINELSRKFERDSEALQPILRELKEYLGKDLKRWIAEDFFFYHCQRFGGRPIIWQFTSNPNSPSEAALNLFLNYHQLDENTLPMIRVDYVQPILKLYEQRKDTGILPEDEIYKVNELTEFLKTFLDLESGYNSIPSPNTLAGNKAQKGKGADKTWGWVFSEAEKIIKDGYKPNKFKGVLINLIPLCLDLPESKKADFNMIWRFLCPKGTINNILKKMNALDQLKQIPADKNASTEERWDELSDSEKDQEEDIDEVN